MLHDVFICHASQDKDAVVRPLARELVANQVAVWFDEFELRLGDSLREKIDRGLIESRYGVVVLSPSFFERHRPQLSSTAFLFESPRQVRELSFRSGVASTRPLSRPSPQS